MFTRRENQGLNVTTMFGSDENVAVFGDFRYKSHSLGKVVSSPFSILVKVVNGQVTYLQFQEAVTGNVSNPDCRDATEVGIDKMYTQIIREVPVRRDDWHHVDIALTRHDVEVWVDYFLDHQPVAHIENVGIPLDKQGVSFTGIYPSLGSGERLAQQLDSVRFGHGLFSLVDAFPFQHPGAPDLSISIPAPTPPIRTAAGRVRLYGQGASGSFDNFTTLTISGKTGPASPSEIVRALAAARGSRGL